MWEVLLCCCCLVALQFAIKISQKFKKSYVQFFKAITRRASCLVISSLKMMVSPLKMRASSCAVVRTYFWVVLTCFVVIFWQVFNFQSDWRGYELKPASHSKTRMRKANWKDNLVRSDVCWITFSFFQVIESTTWYWIIKIIQLVIICNAKVCNVCCSRCWGRSWKVMYKIMSLSSYI